MKVGNQSMFIQLAREVAVAGVAALQYSKGTDGPFTSSR